MYGVDVRRARRWFWALTVLAVADMGLLYRALRSAPSVGTGLTVLGSGLVLALTATQGTRVWSALGGHRPRE